MNLAETLARVVCALRLPQLARMTIGRRRASILLYHDPTPETVDAHLTYLKDRYALIPLDRMVAAIRDGQFNRLQPCSLAITIDDGHRGNRALLEVFRRHGVVPTIYLCSQIVGTDRHFWFLDTPDPEPLKALPNDERLRVLAAAGFDQAAPDAAGIRQALSYLEISELADHFSFGGHTRFHPILPMCSDEGAADEIGMCRAELEERLQRPCIHFAYPNGDHSPRDLNLVRQAGYLSGRTTRIGWVGPRTEPYRLPILGVPDDASVTRLAADLTGITSWLAHHWTGSIPIPVHAGR